MAAFIANHVKHLITLGFICGVVSLLIKFLDEKLSSEQKQVFEGWVHICQLKTGSWSANAIYKRANGNATNYCAGFVLAGTALFFILDKLSKLHLLERNGHQETFATPSIYAANIFIVIICAMMSSVLLFSTFLKPTFEKAKRQLLIVVSAFALVAACVYGSAVYVELQDAAFSFSLLAKAYCGVREAYDGLMICWLYFCALCTLPLATVMFSALPIGSINRTVQWLAKYPKGPWAGLVFALTMLLGITRLFL